MDLDVRKLHVIQFTWKMFWDTEFALQKICDEFLGESLQGISTPEDNFGFRLRRNLDMTFHDIMT